MHSASKWLFHFAQFIISTRARILIRNWTIVHFCSILHRSHFLPSLLPLFVATLTTDFHWQETTLNAKWLHFWRSFLLLFPLLLAFSPSFYLQCRETAPMMLFYCFHTKAASTDTEQGHRAVNISRGCSLPTCPSCRLQLGGHLSNDINLPPTPMNPATI